jgi:hypothetical protein
MCPPATTAAAILRGLRCRPCSEEAPGEFGGVAVAAASFPQLARPLVHFEGSKADNPGLISIRHCQPRIASVALKTRFPGVRVGYVSLLRDPLWKTGAPLVLGIDVDGVTSNSEVPTGSTFRIADKPLVARQS